MFVNSWALLGLLGIGLPLAVHWLTKPRPVHMPISTLRFVREAIEQRRAKHRLKDWLVLALRMAAIAFFVSALARPRHKQAVAPITADADVIRVVLVDASQSMAAVFNGASAMQRARVKAGAHLKHQPGLRANLVVAGAEPHAVFGEPSQNLKALRDHLATVDAKPERIDVQRAINRAGEMFAMRPGQTDADKQRWELVVVSDFQRSSWASADFSVLPSDTEIQFESASPDDAIPNLGILSCGVIRSVRGGVPAPLGTAGANQAAFEQSDFESRAVAGATSLLAVNVGNFSNTPQQVAVEVSLCDATYRLEGNCAANSATTLSEMITFDQPGWCIGEARLASHSDALPADDRRPLAVQVRSQPRLLLVTRQSALQPTSSSFYLRCALSSDLERPNADNAGKGVVTMAPEELDSQRLATFDVLIADHPGKLSPETIELFSAAIERGRPMIYVASESIDATNLKQIIDAANVQLPVDFSPPPPSQERRDLFWTSVQEDAKPFAVFGDGLDGIVSTLRFSGGLNSRVRSDGIREEILAEYQDRSASLIVGGSNTSRLAVLNADLGRSNLPTTGALVPFLDQLVDDLLSANHVMEDAVCGELLVFRLPPSVSAANDLKIVSPRPRTQGSSPGAIDHDGIGVVWTWPSPDTPGVFQVQRRGETLYAQAIHVPADESPLDMLPREVLTQRLAAGLSARYHHASESRQSRDTLWSWLLTACVCCVLVEITSLLLFKT